MKLQKANRKSRLRNSGRDTIINKYRSDPNNNLLYIKRIVDLKEQVRCMHFYLIFSWVLIIVLAVMLVMCMLNQGECYETFGSILHSDYLQTLMGAGR